MIYIYIIYVIYIYIWNHSTILFLGASKSNSLPSSLLYPARKLWVSHPPPPGFPPRIPQAPAKHPPWKPIDCRETLVAELTPTSVRHLSPHPFFKRVSFAEASEQVLILAEKHHNSGRDPNFYNMGVSKIGVPPNHPILIGFSIINHPFLGTPIFGNTHVFHE